MRKVKIITDSCADIGADLLEKHGIDYAYMTTILNENESPACLTWSKDDAHRFYNTIREGSRIFTAQVSMQEFERVFTVYLEKGYDIVYIACSSKQSGSVNTGHLCAQTLLEKYPDARIYCIDSLNASMGEGLLAVEAAKMAQSGCDAAKINDYIISVRKNVRQYVTVHTLEHLKKAGRVSGASAFFGNLMNIKPILISDANGVQTPIKKVRGREASFNEIVEKLRATATDIEEQTVYIAHADCSDAEVEELVGKVREAINCKDVYVGLIGPIIGASIGPDAVGIWAMGEKVTYAAEVRE